MSKKLVVTLILFILLSFLLNLRLNRAEVKADGHSFRNTEAGTIVVPDYYPTIQEAIDAANSGDTVYVCNGTYYEKIVVNKSLSLVGEDRNTTVIDGKGTGPIVRITANNVSLRGFTIRNSGLDGPLFYSSGILLFSSFSTVIDNQVIDAQAGIYLYEAPHNTIQGNIVRNTSFYGVLLDYSEGNVISDNTAAEGCLGIGLDTSNGDTLMNNTVNNNSWYGIYMFSLQDAACDNNTLISNRIANNTCGVCLAHSRGNTITGNVISTNGIGIRLQSSGNNTIYHNNFLNNSVSLENPYISADSWSVGYPSGGNYWTDYNGADSYSGPYENETGSDGIGDTAHRIDANSIDEYPLIGIFSSFNTSLGYAVDVVSNSTVEGFEYSESNTTIRMRLHNMATDQTHGFCRISIPHALFSPPYNISINNNLVSYATIYENHTIGVIYFNYEHPTLELVIVSDLPFPGVLPLFTIATLVAIMVRRKKRFV